jgi:TIR domain
MEATPEPVAADRRLRVFLCHSSGDKPAVRDLYHRLKNDGFAPWLDDEELLPGQDWHEEIPAAVRACDVVLICLSQKSVSKEGYLQREIRDALFVAEEKPEGTIFIIPVKLEEVEVPRRLSQWQWANLFQDGGYQRLVRSLKARASAIGVRVASDPTFVAPLFSSSQPAISRQEEIRRGSTADADREARESEESALGKVETERAAKAKAERERLARTKAAREPLERKQSAGAVPRGVADLVGVGGASVEWRKAFVFFLANLVAPLVAAGARFLSEIHIVAPYALILTVCAIGAFRWIRKPALAAALASAAAAVLLAFWGLI